MRDGGWKKSRNSLYGEFYRPSQVKNTEERRKSQSGTIKKLSEPKRRNLKYSLQLEEMRKSFHP